MPSSHLLTSTVCTEGDGTAHPQPGEAKVLAGGRPARCPQESDSKVGRPVAPRLGDCPRHSPVHCVSAIPGEFAGPAWVTGVKLGVGFTNSFLLCSANIFHHVSCQGARPFRKFSVHSLQDLQTHEITPSLMGPRTGELEATH